MTGLGSTVQAADGQLVPGGPTQHAIATFVGISPEACDAFLTNLVHIARDDALARARAHGPSLNDLCAECRWPGPDQRHGSIQPYGSMRARILGRGGHHAALPGR